jgi:hypothetical protein
MSPKVFEFRYNNGHFWVGSFSAEWSTEDSKLKVSEDLFNVSEHTISDKRWKAFWKKLDTMEAWAWPSEADSYIEDGPSWEIKITHGERHLDLSGTHQAPKDQDGRKLFGPLIKAIKALYAPTSA